MDGAAFDNLLFGSHYRRYDWLAGCPRLGRRRIRELAIGLTTDLVPA